jgi:hypothetical protein
VGPEPTVIYSPQVTAPLTMRRSRFAQIRGAAHAAGSAAEATTDPTTGPIWLTQPGGTTSAEVRPGSSSGGRGAVAARTAGGRPIG